MSIGNAKFIKAVIMVDEIIIISCIMILKSLREWVSIYPIYSFHYIN